MKQENFKDAFEFIFCWPSTDVHAVGLWVVGFPSETPLKKTKSFFASGYQLEIASESGMGACVHSFFQL